MKTHLRFVTTATAIAAMTLTAFAQPPQRDRGPRDRSPDGRGPGGPGGPPPEMMMRMMPVLVALDADKDGKISSEEIDNATAALKKLDKNKDGQLTIEELRPNFPGMRGRPGLGGRPGPGGRLGGDGRSGRPDSARRGDSDSPRLRNEAMARMFELRDANDDGKLSEDELPEQMKERLLRLDANKDGSITKEEMQSAMARRARLGQRARGNDRPEGDRPRRQRNRDGAERDGDRGRAERDGDRGDAQPEADK